MAFTIPEKHYFSSLEAVPNNYLPALVYRNVLPSPVSNDSAQKLCERNHWEKRGEWGAITTAHFHPNTHECYAIFRGSSRLVLGRSISDDDPNGIEIDVSAGDVVVVPAGVSHRSLTSEAGYKYIGVYPETAPKWRNNWCKGEEDMRSLATEIDNVEIPAHDPVFGENGPLVEIWRKAKENHEIEIKKV
ncbi:hypothetical protein M501DRAFT_994015 [Patellaria atrata CBS 101060]|uniref:Cupin type-1 domain-containing protein n=1 Tax=Patellaria atrata CBS 101060 TaxID=1346257 RepID=A0A9P4SIW9_9PEZI|nr:hypothetical protein M501DRAFT_994015 [Patellaria atrata CBS 101060]